jgi:hypothetical protein
MTPIQLSNSPTRWSVATRHRPVFIPAPGRAGRFRGLLFKPDAPSRFPKTPERARGTQGVMAARSPGALESHFQTHRRLRTGAQSSSRLRSARDGLTACCTSRRHRCRLAGTDELSPGLALGPSVRDASLRHRDGPVASRPATGNDRDRPFHRDGMASRYAEIYFWKRRFFRPVRDLCAPGLSRCRARRFSSRPGHQHRHGRP